MVKLCYVDEAGCMGALPTATSNIQPTLAILGMVVDYSAIHQMTSALIALKQRNFPNLLPNSATHLDWIAAEIKGADLRKQIDSSSRNNRRHSFRVIDEMIRVCDHADIKILGRLWIKSIGNDIKSMSIYTSSLQSIYTAFNKYLSETDEFGFVVVDSRLKHLNTQVAHSIFTQKFKGTGDSYDRIVELPAFSHSDNHAGLQLVDFICSAIVTPIAIETYCKGRVQSVHVRNNYSLIKSKYAQWLKEKQYRYVEASGRSLGGVIVSDGLTQRPGGALFR